MKSLGDPSKGAICILITNDHAIACYSMRTFLELQDTGALPIEAVGMVYNRFDTDTLLRSILPDTILLDLVMPKPG